MGPHWVRAHQRRVGTNTVAEGEIEAGGAREGTGRVTLGGAGEGRLHRGGVAGEDGEPNIKNWNCMN